MLLNDYQREASGTAIYPGRMSPHGLMYCALKMNGEAGELADHIVIAKVQEGFLPGAIGLRPERLSLIIKEVGDVMWYLAAMADELETDLNFIFGGEPIIFENNILAIDTEALVLNAVVGQIAEQIGKAMRDDGYGMPASYPRGVLRQSDTPVVTYGDAGPVQMHLTVDRRSKILTHMREAMQSLKNICAEMDITIQLAMDINIRKLAARKAKGTLSGSGDNR